MGDSAMSMMSGPHGDLGPAHCRNLPSITASTSSDSQALRYPPFPPDLHNYPETLFGSAGLKKSQA